MLATNGDNLRNLALSLRKTNLARLYRRRPDGIFVSDLKQGEIGPDLFRKACEFGLEELVSKHRDRPYRGGRPDRSDLEPRSVRTVCGRRGADIRPDFHWNSRAPSRF